MENYSKYSKRKKKLYLYTGLAFFSSTEVFGCAKRLIYSRLLICEINQILINIR
jgi:hypothetical protein